MNNLALNNNITMNHVELCDLINQLRKEEGNRKKLAQRDFIKKIRKELETLKTLGLKGMGNFSQSYFEDSQGKKHETYLMNRDAILQMAASESVYVRAKIIEYINALENKLQEYEIPSYQIEDPIKRALRWIEEEQKRIHLEEENKSLIKENEFLKNENERLHINMQNDLSISDTKQMINHIVRTMGYKMFRKKYNLAWEAFYRFINYELDTNVNNRKGSGLDRFTEKELKKMLAVAIKWAKLNNIEVNNGISNLSLLDQINLNDVKVF